MRRSRIQRCLMAGIVMTAVGFAGAAVAEPDLSGSWQALEYQDWQLQGPGPDAVDYAGIPINDQARQVALSYSAEQLSLPERQCLMYSPVYLLMNPVGFRVTNQLDTVTGDVVTWNISQSGDVAGLQIWMDGRPTPSDASNHEIAGFSTGHWEGDTLVVHVTHMKRGQLRRNGLPHSDLAEMTLHLIRHGNLLTITGAVDDPAYLTEPFVLSRVYIQNEAGGAEISAFRSKFQCRPTVEVADYAKLGTVPHYLPNENPNKSDLPQRLHIPLSAAMGGAPTMYPEFREQLRGKYVPPAKCDRYCCGWDGLGAAATTLKACPTFSVGKPIPFSVPSPITP